MRYLPSSMQHVVAITAMASIFASVFASVTACDDGETPVIAPGASRCLPVAGELEDDFERYRDEAGYRCALMMRDLVEGENSYGIDRRVHYAVVGTGWDALPLRDPLSRPFARDDIAKMGASEVLPFDDVTRLVPAQTPSSEAEWVALGQRVFFEYPLRASGVYEAVARIDRLDEVGFLTEEFGPTNEERFVGLRAFVDDDDFTQSVRVGQTCAQCHASRDEFDVVTGQRSNREMDIGRARVITAGFEPGNLPPELDSTKTADYDRLGAGRADVLGDDVFNPYAFPDFGGLRDMPFLHHNANWVNGGVATLAIRCETLIITSGSARTRPPRVLTWALAKYIRSLPPSSPLDVTPAPEATRGGEIFDEQGCSGCHVPPLYSSARRVPTGEVGTDASAALSFPRASGGYRIPSLRGIGRLAPYLHHGAFGTLEEMFDPARLTAEPEAGEEPIERGHAFGLSLDDSERAALLAFLRSI